jgi:hypothetical protein
MNIDFSSIVSLITGLAGAGPWGILAMVLGGGALTFFVNAAIKKFNAKTDRSDMERAGADAGETSTDMRKQGRYVKKRMDDLSGGFTGEIPKEKKEKAQVLSLGVPKKKAVRKKKKAKKVTKKKRSKKVKKRGKR